MVCRRHSCHDHYSELYRNRSVPLLSQSVSPFSHLLSAHSSSSSFHYYDGMPWTGTHLLFHDVSMYIYSHTDFRNKTEGIFVQDFPAIPDGEPDDKSEFGRDLRDYFQHLSK